MKRKIKRKVFMMGMAVTATFPLGPSAKASGKPDHDSHPYSSWRGSQLSIPINEAGAMDAGRIPMWGKLRNLLGGAGYGAGTASAYAQDKGWRMELLRSESAAAPSGDIPLAQDRRFGLAFRLSF